MQSDQIRGPFAPPGPREEEPQVIDDFAADIEENVAGDDPEVEEQRFVGQSPVPGQRLSQEDVEGTPEGQEPEGQLTTAEETAQDAQPEDEADTGEDEATPEATEQDDADAVEDSAAEEQPEQQPEDALDGAPADQEDAAQETPEETESGEDTVEAESAAAAEGDEPEGDEPAEVAMPADAADEEQTGEDVADETAEPAEAVADEQAELEEQAEPEEQDDQQEQAELEEPQAAAEEGETTDETVLDTVDSADFVDAPQATGDLFAVPEAVVIEPEAEAADEAPAEFEATEIEAVTDTEPEAAETEPEAETVLPAVDTATEDTAAEDTAAEDTATEDTAAEDIAPQEAAAEEEAPEPVAAGPAWDAEAAEDLRRRWHEVQVRFVDDPAAAARDAQALADEAVQGLMTELEARKSALSGWTDAAGDTEQLRLAVQRYRDLLEFALPKNE